MDTIVKTHVYEDVELLIEAGAKLLLQTANEASEARGRFNLVLSGGGTPIPLYKRLAQPPYKQGMPWGVTHFYWGDERCVPPDHAESNYGQAARHLLIPNRIPPSRVHRIRGEFSHVEAAAKYSNELLGYHGGSENGPLFDLVLLGLGSDGHLASLFPGSMTDEEKDSLAMAVSADYDGRPADRVTLTPLAINQASHVLFLVTGTSKAEAVYDAIFGKHDPLLHPAHRIQPADGIIYWMVDREAGANLVTGQQFDVR
jgi:6-phosphogluconolactonase